MRVTYRLALEDYYDAARARDAKHLRIRRGAALGASVLLLGYWMASGRDARVGRACLLLVAFAFVVYLLTRWIDKLRFRNSYRTGAAPGLDGKELTVDISEEGVQGPEAQNKEQWSHFSKYSESDKAFILYRADSIHAIFPKRAFDADAMNRLRQLLSRKLERC